MLTCYRRKAEALAGWHTRLLHGVKGLLSALAFCSDIPGNDDARRAERRTLCVRKEATITLELSLQILHALFVSCRHV